MNFLPPWWARNGHFQSIYPSLFRRLSDDIFERTRITTRDQDFLDLDWAKKGHRRLLIISHGLEGHSRRPYVLGMAHAALAHNWDVLGWNFRSCSGEPNHKLNSYHSGATQDLIEVVEHAATFNYDEICLVGFSIGGNKTLLYLGRETSSVNPKVNAAVTFSVPCDLTSTSAHLAKPSNRIYMKNFLLSLKEKLKEKQAIYPKDINLKGFRKIKTFADFDGRYTAPMNGFSSAEEYWRKSSSLPYLKNIQVPTLMISALDDPFLTPKCFPYEAVQGNPKLTLETPRHGGHVGFMSTLNESKYWSEIRALNFFDTLSNTQANHD